MRKPPRSGGALVRRLRRRGVHRRAALVLLFAPPSSVRLSSLTQATQIHCVWETSVSLERLTYKCVAKLLNSPKKGKEMPVSPGGAAWCSQGRQPLDRNRPPLLSLA